MVFFAKYSGKSECLAPIVVKIPQNQKLAIVGMKSDRQEALE